VFSYFRDEQKQKKNFLGGAKKKPNYHQVGVNAPQ
jgi:hypothetical protein